VTTKKDPGALLKPGLGSFQVALGRSETGSGDTHNCAVGIELTPGAPLRQITEWRFARG